MLTMNKKIFIMDCSGINSKKNNNSLLVVIFNYVNINVLSLESVC